MVPEEAFINNGEAWQLSTRAGNRDCIINRTHEEESKLDLKQRYKHSKFILNDILSPSKPHFLKVP